ncbi:C40 family peptidase [Ferruginibacter yonginensis]|uniref:C40 family peptidase n=1 Tax=Ferruginibacter yonginensis TaxID=1310416 RepID=A0ABV8QNQ7_9BACT
MKNLLFVAVALSVFTVTSLTASAQKNKNFFADANKMVDGMMFLPTQQLSKQAAVSYNAIKQNIAPVVTMATELCNKLHFKYAQLLNRDVEYLTNTSLLSFIDEWWGTRYRYGGSTKSGIDCSSFTGLLMGTVFGFALPRTAREQYASCTKLSFNEMAEGDLVFFNTRGGVSHVGVYLGDGYFVHSSSHDGVTISNISENYYAKRFIAGGRPLAIAALKNTNDADCGSN